MFENLQSNELHFKSIKILVLKIFFFKSFRTFCFLLVCRSVRLFAISRRKKIRKLKDEKIRYPATPHSFRIRKDYLQQHYFFRSKVFGKQSFDELLHRHHHLDVSYSVAPIQFSIPILSSSEPSSEWLQMDTDVNCSIVYLNRFVSIFFAIFVSFSFSDVTLDEFETLVSLPNDKKFDFIASKKIRFQS